ncbi:transposase [Streptomyces sp. NPDC090077]|uniref:transposase n=1 Tax=Streptomyces sp. NPDC090077 TaxID=3365938 RepID=UPI0038292D26
MPVGLVLEGPPPDERDCWSCWFLRRCRSELCGFSVSTSSPSAGGRTYGTILVDVEGGHVVDVLSGRTSETFAARLREHPDAAITSRDRASSYTCAIKEAAPAAVEVADPWHLLQNLAAVVEKTCHQHRACLRKRADEVTDGIPEGLDPGEAWILMVQEIGVPSLRFAGPQVSGRA